MDINFSNIKTSDGDFYIKVDDVPVKVAGNKALANIFEMTFLTNVNDSLMSYGHGGDGVGTVSNSYDPNDLQSIAAAIKVACDNAVVAMKVDETNDANIPATERVVIARVLTVSKTVDTVYASVEIVPEEYDSAPLGQPIILTLPL